MIYELIFKQTDPDNDAESAYYELSTRSLYRVSEQLQVWLDRVRTKTAPFTSSGESPNTRLPSGPFTFGGSK